MSKPTLPTAPPVPIPVRKILALHPGITARRAAPLLGWNYRSTAARLGKLAMYGTIDRAELPRAGKGRGIEYGYRLKDEAHA